MSDPVLVLQMQRMGDLIMTFPLLAWLQHRHRGHPLWVVAEERFFRPLQALSPSVVYFPPEAAPRLRGVRFRAVCNVSHRADAAALCGQVQAQERFGPWEKDGATYINGPWALYRASLVHNNRHNRYHWGDLQLLDHLGDPPSLPRPGSPAAPNTTSRKVCLVVGASEPEKRPDAAFWGTLARNLLDRGLFPFFVGSETDSPLGAAAAKLAGMPAGNMCGRFNLTELGSVLRETRLCITPDTGPMHLANWVGAPVLNLSMGPVNPWETGPANPGQLVLRARTSCSGCWRCHQAGQRCRQPFAPGAVAALAAMLVNRPASVAHWHSPGLELLHSQRDARGLYRLCPTNPPATEGARPRCRDMVATLWQEWFWASLTPSTGATGAATARDFSRLTQAMHTLAERAPRLHQRMHAAMVRLEQELSRHISGRVEMAPPRDFWRMHPPFLRPLTGYLHLRLQNGNHDLAAWRSALRDVAAFAALLGA